MGASLIAHTGVILPAKTLNGRNVKTILKLMP